MHLCRALTLRCEHTRGESHARERTCGKRVAPGPGTRTGVLPRWLPSVGSTASRPQTSRSLHTRVARTRPLDLPPLPPASSGLVARRRSRARPWHRLSGSRPGRDRRAPRRRASVSRDDNGDDDDGPDAALPASVPRTRPTQRVTSRFNVATGERGTGTAPGAHYGPGPPARAGTSRRSALGPASAADRYSRTPRARKSPARPPWVLGWRALSRARVLPRKCVGRGRRGVPPWCMCRAGFGRWRYVAGATRTRRSLRKRAGYAASQLVVRGEAWPSGRADGRASAGCVCAGGAHMLARCVWPPEGVQGPATCA